jgi:hypothetical protein
MVTSFHKACRRLSRAEISAIDGVLRAWQQHPIGRVVAPNLRDKEHFLPGRPMLALLRVLLDTKSAPISELQQRYQDECYLHQRQGGMVRISPLPEYLGRAVETSIFTNDLFRRYRTYFTKKAHAKDFVMRLKAGTPLDASEQEMLMSQFTSWTTWAVGASDPFDFVVHGLAVEVRAAMGLDERHKGALLLLRYTRPRDLRLHRPTIADAGLFPYFDPPIGSETAHSYTRPWPAKRVSGIPHDLSAAPRPEAVHSPVKFEHVTSVSELR